MGVRGTEPSPWHPSVDSSASVQPGVGVRLP
jgi:hypothetical protein